MYMFSCVSNKWHLNYNVHDYKKEHLVFNEYNM